jgi:2-dehydro-3-deoxyphosphogluconate aldolase/(4S)-4-hydroxy-2-oxoglutarate aldolase
MLAHKQSAIARELAAKAPIIPVIVIDDLAHAQPLAEALVAGGLPVLEVTLRTPVALEAIKVMAQVPGGVVGAGTVLTESDMQAAKQAGAQFAVSPGATPRLVQAATQQALPLLPGAATSSDVMALYEQGYDMLKFFPAEANGGIPALKALGGPFPQITFCPTGGVTPENARAYLGLPNVVCAGGSWVAPKSLRDAGDWVGVEALARDAALLA